MGFRIVPCLAGGNASATCLKMLVMLFADVQLPAPLSLHSMFKVQYKSQAIIIISAMNKVMMKKDYIFSIDLRPVYLSVKH